jgi:hypothetical protein
MLLDLKLANGTCAPHLSEGLQPNASWCTDYKGQFMLGDRRCCYPLMVPIMLRAIYCCAKQRNRTPTGPDSWSFGAAGGI